MHASLCALKPTLLLVFAFGLGSAQTNPYGPIPVLLPPRAVTRILEQGTWGPTLAGSAILERKGFDQWFSSQLVAPVSTYADQPMLDAMGKTNTNVTPTQVQFFQNALNGEDQLRQRVAFALSQIWVVSEAELNSAAAMPPILRLFQRDAFLNYEQIMRDMTLNPAMGRYLNMVNNDKGNAAKGTSPNENYSRELLQLFTVGLSQLNVDGSPVLNADGIPAPAYTQATVTALAKCFTGWTYPPMTGSVTRGHNPVYYLNPMVAIETNHDTSEKSLFPGFTIHAGQTAEQDAKDALHAIFLQPGLPPFVSRQLIQHLTTSNPSPAYVQRVAEVFMNSGTGIRGDMRRVIYAILSDPEARAGDDPNQEPNPTFGHMREPILLALNLLRGLNGTVADGSTIASRVSSLGEQLFYPPSVFSYFSPSYRTSDGLVAPEFQIYSTQAASNRINLINSAVYGGLLDPGTKFDVSGFVALASSPSKLVESIDTLFFHSAMSVAVKTAIDQAVNAVSSPAEKAKAALYIALTSSEYQIIN